MSQPLSKGRVIFYCAIILSAPIVVYLFAGLHLRFFLVPSESMAPTLQSGDYLATVHDTSYRRGDIVVLRDPEQAGGYLVKRIVGVGGDRVRVTEGGLFVNGHYASEPYTREPMVYEMAEVAIPENEYLVLGDNRNQSDDSSTWDASKGLRRTVPAQDVIGRVVLRYLPFSRAGQIKRFALVNSAGS